MRALRALLVDDSAINRRMLSQMLAELPGVDVVGVAGDGDEALRLSASLEPDVITLDLEMPRMDGFTFLRLLMARRPVPVIVVSSHAGNDNVFRALELGAIDFIAKPDALLAAASDGVRAQLREKIAMIRQLAPAGAASRGTGAVSAAPRTASVERPPRAARAPARLVVVAASTGGPTALLDVFAKLPEDADACVVVAQHMPERFTQAFAARLDRVSAFSVAEASGDVELMPGTALVCPGGKSVEIVRSGDRVFARVVAPETGDRYAPSADRLFVSASAAMGPAVCGVVLTGMGEDGAAGARAIRSAGGRVVVESAETAVIHGMPRAAEQTGAIRASLALPALTEWLARFMRTGEDGA